MSDCFLCVNFVYDARVLGFQLRFRKVLVSVTVYDIISVMISVSLKIPIMVSVTVLYYDYFVWKDGRMVFRI